MSARKYKILKPFYCFHPEIIIDEKPRPAFWGVEWNVVIKNAPQPQITIHCQRNVDTETEAQKLLAELLQECGEFGPWKAWDYQVWYLSVQYRKCVLDRKKRILAYIKKSDSDSL